WGRCFESAGAPAYWPWIQIIRAVVSDRRRSDPRTRNLSTEVARILPEFASEVPEVEEKGDTDQSRFRLFDALARLLMETAQTQPCMLVLDDLHEADMTSLLFLKFIARLLHDAPLIIIGTYRDGEMRRSLERAAIVADVLRDANQLPLGGLA